MIFSFEADPKSSASAPERPYFRHTNAITRSMSERLSRKKVSQFIGDAANGNDARLNRCGDSRRSATVAMQSNVRRTPEPPRYFFVTSGMCFDVVSTNDTSTPLLMRCETSSASQLVSRTQPCDDA